MKITKQQLKQIIKEELEPYDLSALVPKGEDPEKRAAAIQAARDDFRIHGEPVGRDKWEKTGYYEYYKDAFYNAKQEKEKGFVDRMGE